MRSSHYMPNSFSKDSLLLKLYLIATRYAVWGMQIVYAISPALGSSDVALSQRLFSVAPYILRAARQRSAESKDRCNVTTKVLVNCHKVKTSTKVNWHNFDDLVRQCYWVWGNMTSITV